VVFPIMYEVIGVRRRS